MSFLRAIAFYEEMEMFSWSDGVDDVDYFLSDHLFLLFILRYPLLWFLVFRKLRRSSSHPAEGET